MALLLEQPQPPAAWLQWMSLEQLPKLLPPPLEIVPEREEENR